MNPLQQMMTTALAELQHVLLQISEERLDLVARELTQARRIALYGCGREGLMMRALAMRLYHLGLEVSMVGEMTTPPLGDGDLLLVSAGPGELATVAALVSVARTAGARTLCITAVPEASIPQQCDVILEIPAQTMANDTPSLEPLSVIPMGSLFEGAQFLLFELLVLRLRDRLGETSESMRARHTNLE